MYKEKKMSISDVHGFEIVKKINKCCITESQWLCENVTLSCCAKWFPIIFSLVSVTDPMPILLTNG